MEGKEKEESEGGAKVGREGWWEEWKVDRSGQTREGKEEGRKKIKGKQT